MPLPYVYRVTKYDPADRDEHGHYTGAEDTVSDHGEIEAACLRAVEAFAVEAGVDRLRVREPQVPSLTHFGAERPPEDFGLDGLFPTGLKVWRTLRESAVFGADAQNLIIRARLALDLT